MVRVRIGVWNPESLADRSIAHGDPDRTIPASEAQLLFASANEPKRLLIIPGAGHVPFGSAGEQYLNQVEEFMREALRAR